MMESIIKSLPGMAIAFVALFLVMGIYGIIGVDFWGEKYPDFFGNFLKAVLTLLQIMSFDSWCSGVAREIIFSSGGVPVVYFVSYVFIASIIMLNVLVSLMLEVFMKKDNQDAGEDIEELQREQIKKFASSEYADKEVLTFGITSTEKPTANGSHSKNRASLSDCVLFVGDSSDKSSSNDSTAKRRVINRQLDQLHEGIAHFKAYLAENIQGDDMLQDTTGPEWGFRLDGHVQNMIRLLEGLHIEIDLLNKELDLVDSKCSSFISHRHGLWGITAQSLGAISK